MENLMNKPPKSAMKYYMKLYCKKKALSSKEPSNVQEALKSWLLLSAAEQEPFIEKFKKCQRDYEKKCAFYLKSVEPFMKKKPSREGQINDTCASETNINSHNENHFEDLSRNMMNDTDDKIDDICNEASSPEQTRATSIIEGIQQQNNDQLPQVPEPSPPTMTNGKELFDAVNSTGGNDLQWKDLSQKDRGKYNRAVLSIKRDYIRKYQIYLESLPSEELFQHYIRSQEN